MRRTKNMTHVLEAVVIALGVLAAGHSALSGAVPKISRVGIYGFDVYAEGDTLHLLSAEYVKDSEHPRMLYQRSTDGGATWSQPVRIDRGATPPFIQGRGVDPQIAASGRHLVAVWTTAGDDVFGYGTGPLATVISADGGKTWRPGRTPADDGLTIAHEYIDVVADDAGVFHAIWMDDREHKDGVRRGLHYANSRDGGAIWSRNTTLDDTICGCCWTYLRADSKDVYAFYRDTYPSPSDYVLLRSSNRGQLWERVGVVGKFDWMFKGCPHQPAGLTIAGRTMHALVMTGKEEVAGLHYLSSGDGGRLWSAPRPMATDGRYPDLATTTDGKGVAAVWQSTKARGALVASVSIDAGQHWTAPAAITGPIGNGAGFPRIVSWHGTFRVLWTEVAPDGSFQFVTRILPDRSTSKATAR